MTGPRSRRSLRVADALRLAVGTLTVLPVRPPSRVDARVAGVAMATTPIVGAVLGAAAAAVMWVSTQVVGAWLSALLGVGVLAVLTRLVHWDGLADLADGLGSGRPADEALAVMRRSDTGPFGVMAVVLVLGIQVGAAAEAGPYALAVAVVLGRLGLVLACRRGVPAARADGLGAVVAGSVHPLLLTGSLLGTGLLLVAVVLLGGVPAEAVAGAAAVSVGWVLAVTAHVTRRLGGVTGDVLGALVETTTAVGLLTLAALT